MLALRKLEAQLEEQVAGLLHDASHTAFSHVIDWVVGSHKSESYQDKNHLKIIGSPPVSKILISHNYEPQRIANLNLFGLLEREIPDVCADRFDYAIREFDQDSAMKCINAISNHKGRIAFNSEYDAKLFANNFFNCQEMHWGAEKYKRGYQAFASLLNYAIETRIIAFADFEKNDQTIMDKLYNSKDQEIQTRIDDLRKNALQYSNDYGVKTKQGKFRYVNPHYIMGDKLVRLTKTDLEYKRKLREAIRENELN